MPRTKSEPYECYRCGYNTERRSYMKTHLYDRIGVCFAKKNRIDLTDEIKNDIMENRIYSPNKKQSTPEATSDLNKQSSLILQKQNNILNAKVNLLKSYFLDDYECDLIKNINMISDISRISSILDHLKNYYNFISCFELEPAVNDLTDLDLLGHWISDDNEYILRDRYRKIYCDINDKVYESDKLDRKNTILKNKISKILDGDNTIQNIKELNKAVMDIIKGGTTPLLNPR